MTIHCGKCHQEFTSATAYATHQCLKPKPKDAAGG